MGEEFHDSENELSPIDADQGKLRGGFWPRGHLPLEEDTLETPIHDEKVTKGGPPARKPLNLQKKL